MKTTVHTFVFFNFFTLMVLMTFTSLVKSAPTYGPVPPDPYPDSPPGSPKKDDLKIKINKKEPNRKHLIGR